MSPPVAPTLRLTGGDDAPSGTKIPDPPRGAAPTLRLSARWREFLHPLPAGLLVAALAASLIASSALATRVERIYAQRFTALIEQVEGQVQARLAGCIQVLRGAQGLWNSTGAAEPGAWKRYVATLALEQDYAGVTALDFAPPDTAMLDEPVTREALLRARDTGEPSLSGRVPVPGVNGPVSGFVLALAVYRGAPRTEAERRAAFRGYVYMGIRSAELMKNTLGYKGLYTRYGVYDGDGEHGPLLFSTEQPLEAGAALSRATPLEIAGHRWTIVSQPGALLGTPADVQLPRLIAIGGALIAVLLYALALAWVRTRTRALQLAQQMTADLQARERDLEELSEQLVRSNEDLQQFAYAASHDLKEPLRSISSSLGLIGARYSPRLDDSAREFIGYASDGAQRLSDLIDNLLDFSRVHTHAQPLAAVDLETVLTDALDDLSKLIEESGVEVLRGEMPRVLADRSQVTRVFENLITNAVKYTRRWSPAPQIMITARYEAPLWVIAISDNGIGIAPEHHDKIFQMFKRLHSRTEYEGNGMGLALCKRIVQRHRGEIWVSSAAGEGATFFFSLPPAQPQLRLVGGVGVALATP